MIELHDYNGRVRYVAPSAIATVREAGTSSQWHGIRAYVKLFDGEVLEVNESAESISAMIDAAKPEGDAA